MARKKQTRRAKNIKASDAKTAPDRGETKAEVVDKNENVTVEAPASPEDPVSLQKREKDSVEVDEKSSSDLKRKRDTSDVELKVEKSKKTKSKEEEEHRLKEFSLKIERW